MGLSISNEINIVIEKVPVQWISIVSFYDRALPQYPLKYVHLKQDGKRIFGFPVCAEISVESKGLMTLNLKFLSNVPLGAQEVELVKTELGHRIGSVDPVLRKDVEASCPQTDRRNEFLLKIWDSFIVPSYGGSLPFGRFYDEMSSLPRCAAAFIPLSGGKSELQMLYDFVRHYGEKVEIMIPWSFLEFFLLPTYDELLNRELGDFPTYQKLQQSIDRFAERYFTAEVTVGRLRLRTLGSSIRNLDGYNLQSPSGMRELTQFLVENDELAADEKKELDFLIDAFNRLATRAFGYIGLTCNSNPQNDFRKWDGHLFRQLYLRTEEERTVGIYPKIWGMILQQGFGNPEVVPIDEWVESFYRIPLQIKSKDEFLQRLKRIGKLERMIWVTSQARKTNMDTIFDWLWCLKFGTGKTTKEITGSDEQRLREANPLSCLKCPLKDKCMAYSEVSESNVYVHAIEEQTPNESKVKSVGQPRFVVTAINGVPKFVYRKAGNKYELIDGFTGLEIHELKTSFENQATTVKEFIRDLHN